MRLVSMIPHSYLVHFELVQTCCLLSYAMQILYFDHTHARHQPLSVMNNHAKARHHPERKKKTRKVSHHAHGSLFKKKGEKGKMIRAKV